MPQFPAERGGDATAGQPADGQGEPCLEDPDQRHRQAPVRLAERVVLPLVAVEVAGERGVAGGNLADTHQAAQFPVVIDGGADLVLGQVAPSVTPDPAHRQDNERGEDVDEVVVADVVCAVDPVQAPDRGPSARRRRAVPGYLPQQRDGVVVAFLAVVRELACLVEYLADAGHGEGVEDRQFEGTADLPAEGRVEGLAGDRQPVTVWVQMLGATATSWHSYLA